jgi:TrmH family RNA methyltransferase
MTLDEVRQLQQKKFRDATGCFVVEGEHLILELQKALARQPALADARLFVTPLHADWQSPFPTQVISERQMAKISDTQNPQGMLAVVPHWPAPAPQPGERAIYLHEIQDPGNLGTILRSLGWFGGYRCVLSPNSVDPYNPKVVRASMGAIFHVPIELDVEVSTVAARYPRIACLDLRGAPLSSSGFADFDCYLFGNEARGLPREVLAALQAQAFTVAGGGAIESLNLAAVVNMSVYELNRERA